MREKEPGNFMKAHPVTGQNTTQQIATINGKSCRVELKTKDCN